MSGELTTREYKTTEGVNRTSLELNANIIDLVGKKTINPNPSESNMVKEFLGENSDETFDDGIPF